MIVYRRARPLYPIDVYVEVNQYDILDIIEVPKINNRLSNNSPSGETRCRTSEYF